MLNPLPELLSFGFIAPLILRAVAGAYFLKQAYFELKKRKKKKTETLLALLGALAGLSLIVGFFAQIASFVLLAVIIAEIILKTKKRKLKETEIDFYILITAILISILLSGAGFLAIDLPL
ncbi:MAG: hypothetical protein KAV41_02330 [Candidatus Pacebacteria bacterium]|nr:hypothetical protein [Candidatus Paceibacterota bacterium]